MRRISYYDPSTMSPEKIISCRKQLERKYTNICLHLGIPLGRTDDGSRAISVSPTALYYHCGLNPNGNDNKLFRELNKGAHFGERARIEKEVLDLVKKHCISLLQYKHFFSMKNKILKEIKTHDAWVKEARRDKLPAISKSNFFRVMKLLRRWGEISKEQHYKLNGAQKRINKRIIKNDL